MTSTMKITLRTAMMTMMTSTIDGSDKDSAHADDGGDGIREFGPGSDNRDNIERHLGLKH